MNFSAGLVFLLLAAPASASAKEPPMEIKAGLSVAAKYESRYKTAGDFFVGFEACSRGGRPSEKIGGTVVSGMRVMLYRREVAVSLPPPDTGGPSTFAPEEFCVVPAGKRFFVLSYSYGDSIQFAG